MKNPGNPNGFAINSESRFATNCPMHFINSFGLLMFIVLFAIWTFICEVGNMYKIKKVIYYLIPLVLLGILTSCINSNKNSKKIALEDVEPLLNIEMVTQNFGYAINQDFQILKTEDGCKNWYKIKDIKSVLGKTDTPVILAVENNTVYIAIYSSSGIDCFKSIDAGEKWSLSKIKTQTNPNSAYGGDLYLSFYDKSKGFLYTSNSDALNQSEKELYETTNGGSNWNKIHSQQKSGDSLSINGTVSGMKFVNSSVGYITVNSNQGNALYKTPNGGKIWVPVPLPMPKGISNIGTVISCMAQNSSLGNKNIDMEVLIMSGLQGGRYLYTTEDDGASWILSGEINNMMTHCQRRNFFDPKRRPEMTHIAGYMSAGHPTAGISAGGTV